MKRLADCKSLEERAETVRAYFDAHADPPDQAYRIIAAIWDTLSGEEWDSSTAAHIATLLPTDGHETDVFHIEEPKR